MFLLVKKGNKEYNNLAGGWLSVTCNTMKSNAMLDVGCWMCNVQCAMYSVQCAMCNVQCSMYSVQCAMLYYVSHRSSKEHYNLNTTGAFQPT